MADEMVVRLTLPRHVAERLRAMCHARGMTASRLVEEWIFRANARGEHRVATTYERECWTSILDEIVTTRRK